MTGLALRFALWFALTLALFGNARADDLMIRAITGQGADVATTAIALAMGATEANPLGPLIIPAKLITHHLITQKSAIEQPHLWGLYGAVGWGATANNLCVIGVIATGGAFAAVCPVLGIVTGMSEWDAGQAERDRATFDAICAQEMAKNPELVCVYAAAE